ncbi:MAG: Gfo/Idh/MocA family oxidoreductase [Pirellulales bacterium]|nr:Gfo/Idh/MocA family oxidoreductase [Pirellulales bacterium]
MQKHQLPIKRRHFLQGTASAGGLSLISSSVRLAQARKNAPENTYRVGVIGSTGRGGYGHRLDEAFLEIPQTRIVAVADDNPAGLANAQKRLSAKRTFADYHRMLDEVNLDLVVICPRWVDQHRDMAVAAAQRGIHILIEKPFCRTLAEADEIVTACENSGAKLAIGHITHYSPTLNRVQQLINEGKIGRVLEFRGRGKEDHRGGGQDLWVLGTHIMDLIRALGGHAQWCHATVLQNGRPVTQDDVFEGPEGLGPLAGDEVHATYKMSNGAMAYFSSLKHAGNANRFALQIYGSEGIFEFREGILPVVQYLGDATWSPGHSGAQWQTVSSAGIGKPEPLSGRRYRSRYMLVIEDLLAAIEEDRQPLCGVYEARGTTEMIVAVFESHRQGRPVTLPLENRNNPLTMLR